MRIAVLMLAACATGALNCSAAAHGAPRVAPPAGQQLPHMSLSSVGTGQPVVLIPGLSTPRAVWDEVVPKLARTHRVVLVQVNGFAGDDPGANLAPGVLDGVVEELHGYLASQHLGPVRLVGHSMGGLIGLMAAKAHPEEVRGLMIVDALPYVGDIFVPGATVVRRCLSHEIERTTKSRPAPTFHIAKKFPIESQRVLAGGAPRPFVHERTFPYRSATSCRRSCDHVSRHRRRQQHECRDTGGSHDKRQLWVSQGNSGEQTSHAQRRRFRGCLHSSEDVGHPKNPYASE